MLNLTSFRLWSADPAARSTLEYRMVWVTV